MKTNILKAILIIFGAIFLLWFAAPFIVGGIINIGNSTGIAIATVILVYGLFFSAINRIIRFIWSKIFGKIMLCLVSVAVIIIFLLAFIGTSFMVVAATNKPQSEVTAVVLGCRVYGERPSLMLTERLEAALDYLNNNKNAKCILSGGMGAGEDISEAECMFRWLTERGIDESRLFIEDRSTSTRENLEFSKAILQENGLGDEIAIITNEFHQYRASEVAKNLGLDAYSVNGSTALWLLPTYYVRDLYGIIYEWVF